MTLPEDSKAKVISKPFEYSKYNTAFGLPLMLFAIGIYLLWSAGQVSASSNQTSSQPQDFAKTGISMNVKVEGAIRADTITIPCCVAVIEKEAETEIGEVQIQTPSNEAYQYFLLGSIIFIVLLILPRLKELTISKDSVSFELIQEIEKQVQEVQALVTSSNAHKFTTQQEQDDSNTVQSKLNDIKRKIEIIKLMAGRKNGN